MRNPQLHSNYHQKASHHEFANERSSAAVEHYEEKVSHEFADKRDLTGN